jgi:hypothetical protein
VKLIIGGEHNLALILIGFGVVSGVIPAVIVAYVDKGIGFELCTHLSLKDVDVLEVGIRERNCFVLGKFDTKFI